MRRTPAVQFITWNRQKLHTLIAKYAWAMATKQDSFMFEGHEVLTGYAKYLIEYLERELG